MKKTLTLILITLLTLLLVSCARNFRRNDINPVESPRPVMPTSVQNEASAQVNPAPTSAPTDLPALVPTAVPIEPLTPTTGASQSMQIANDLDHWLNQFNQNLSTVDTLPDEP
jgi:hypothetical protein